MTITQSIILGIIQGLTEFLPISSSGHLVIAPKLLGWHLQANSAFVFDVLVQVATLLAVFVYFRADLWAIFKSFYLGLLHNQPFADPLAREGWFIILATIPAGLVGLVFKSLVERAFNSANATAIFLFLTAGLLLIAERAGKRERDLHNLTWKDALWIGIFQAIAIFPGISRSGATITGGMTRNLQRPAAARFSFIMSIPVMLAAGLLASLDLAKIQNLNILIPTFIPGFVTAAIVGYVSIRWLLGYLTRHPLYVFSIYCTMLGLLVLAFSLVVH